MINRGPIFVLLALVAGGSLPSAATTLVSADFDASDDGFVYADDPFLGTALPDQADGVRTVTAGYGGTGGLQVTLGKVETHPVGGKSGAWNRTLVLDHPATGVAVSFRYRLDIGSAFPYEDYARVLVGFDGVIHGRGTKPYVDHLGGSAPGYSYAYAPTTDWRTTTIALGDVAAGTHLLQIGAYEYEMYNMVAGVATLVVDDVVVTDDNPPPATSAAQVLVDRLNPARYRSNIETLSGFGDRCRYSYCDPARFLNAQAWVAAELTRYGYSVEYHNSQSTCGSVSNLYVTKVGVAHPERMYIVSAHLDGRGGGGAADDDGSGVSLVLETARALAPSTVSMDTSVRMIFWDAEEPGSCGSGTYVADRKALQGVEDPVGSGRYPEPLWAGMLQHDMLLFDHGPGFFPLSNAPLQSPYADIDVEWNRSATPWLAASRTLALAWQEFNGTYAMQYPSTAYDDSAWTDSTAFANYAPSISVRENRRMDRGEWNNPNWHQATDLYANYSSADFALAFSAVQTTLGAVATLANAHVAPLPDALFRDGFE